MTRRFHTCTIKFQRVAQEAAGLYCSLVGGSRIVLLISRRFQVCTVNFQQVPGVPLCAQLHRRRNVLLILEYTFLVTTCQIQFRSLSLLMTIPIGQCFS